MRALSVFSLVVLCCIQVLSQNELTPVFGVNSVSFNLSDGATPTNGSLILATDGNFYGATQSGGANGTGVVYRVTPLGTLSVVYDFCSEPNCADGGTPMAGVMQGADGNLYGTTTIGGANNCGTIYQLSLSGSLKTLHSFCSDASDGYQARGTLVQFVKGTGSYYGTTAQGGVNNAGTIFRVNPVKGTYLVLHSFCSELNCPDGANPASGLREFSEGGRFFGTTEYGGQYQAGVAFQFKYSGYLSVVYNFCSQSDCTDGGAPISNPVAIGDVFYGTTSQYGANGGGTAYTLTDRGQFTLLYSFCSLPNCADGSSPTGLMRRQYGSLFGTTSGGGTYEAGTLFEMTPKGKLASVYEFCSQPRCDDGQNPTAPLVEGSDDNLYGTTSSGGTAGFGTVFRYRVKTGN